jgi:two-component SAPR family response regulator
MLWDNVSDQQARSCLNTTLWRLRSVLEPGKTPRGTFLMTNQVGRIGFNWTSDHWLDIVAYKNQVEHLLATPIKLLDEANVQASEQVLTWYDNSYLKAYYSDWAIRERERIRRYHINGLGHIMSYYSQKGSYAHALRHGQSILELDPLREQYHREIMRLHLTNGHRAQAVRQYEICRQLLEQELGIQPMAETRTLIEDAKQLYSRRTVHSVSKHLMNSQAMNELRLARKDFDRAQHRLQTAIQTIEHSLDWK